MREPREFVLTDRQAQVVAAAVVYGVVGAGPRLGIAWPTVKATIIQARARFGAVSLTHLVWLAWDDLSPWLTLYWPPTQGAPRW